jgi:hypothetical protein
MVLDEVRGDAPVPAAVLDKLEERYLRPIAQAAKLEGLLADPLFLADPINHPALSLGSRPDPRTRCRCLLPRISPKRRTAC